MARAFALVVLLSILPPAAALADEPPAGKGPAKEKPAEVAPDDKAKEALERFKRESATEDVDLRMEALTRLARVDHPDVATLLLDLALKGKDPAFRSAAFKGLAGQKGSTKTIGPRVSRWLVDAAAENRKAKARGDYGVLVDKETGEVDVKSEAGKAVLRAKRDRGKMIAEAMRLIDGLGWREKDSLDALRDFLEDGNDEAVAITLGMLGKWKEWTVLPDLQTLFDMYPDEESFETGSTAVDTGASGNEDSSAAKRKWMAKFGDPDKRRARPKVVKALKKAILDITGEKVETPAALKELRKRPDVKRKERG